MALFGGSGGSDEAPRSYEFDPPDPDEPYDMNFATSLSRWIFMGFVAFGLLAGALLWLRLPA